ncbi:unnamed protein product [Discosporangium mesarthrocarpum]
MAKPSNKKGGTTSRTATFVKMLDAKPRPMPELSEVEKARNMEIGRRYNQMCAKAHNARMANLNMKIKLRDEAIANLPEMLRHAALQRETQLPPLNRRMARYTPPQPGFDPKDYLGDEHDKEREGE